MLLIYGHNWKDAVSIEGITAEIIQNLADTDAHIVFTEDTLSIISSSQDNPSILEALSISSKKILEEVS